MKSTIKLIIAAFAAGATLISCTRDIITPEVVGDKPSQQSEGSRVITVSFAPQTKTDFSTSEDGKIAPYFVKGDKIVLCSDTQDPTDDNTETCEVDVDDETKVATITTKLSGALTAFYPADYVGKGDKLGLCIPANQSGEFKDANFVAATIADGESSAEFENISALFKISIPKSIKKLTVKSLCEIGSDGQRSGDRRSINDEGDTDQKRCSVVVGDGTTNIEFPCYVALSPGVNLSDLSFEATSDAEGTTGYIKGITTSAIAATAGTDVAVGSEAYDESNTVAAGAAYTINNSNWHPYVTVAGRKWATMNIGAESETAAGEYFMWGEVVGHKLINKEWTNFPSENPDVSRYGETWNGEKKFAGCNAPFISSATQPSESWECEYSKYNTTDNKSVLELCDDAANANWGGAWRMPTGTEFSGMLSNTSTTAADIISQVLIIKGTNLKFPGVGSYWEPTQKDMGYVVYWTSSLDDEEYAKRLYAQVYAYVANVGNALRWHGHPIRAIIDDPDAVTPSTPEEREDVLLPGRFTVGSDKEVNFTKGNLYWDGSKWAIEENQYDFPMTAEQNHVKLLFWTKEADNSYVYNSAYSESPWTSSDDKLFCGGGENHTLTIGGNSGLYALSSSEWQYLFNSRDNANELYATDVDLAGKSYSLVIAPDECTNDYTFDNSKLSYTLQEYEEATEAGVVFLPAAGYNLFGEVEGFQTIGYYWTSTVDGSVDKAAQAYSLNISEANTASISRLIGCSIRLVKKVTQAQK